MGIDRETRQPSLRVELFVGDVAASARFYVEVLGFRVRRDDGSGYVSVGRSGVVIGLNRMVDLAEGHPVKAAVGQSVGRGVELVVAMSDIESAYARAAASGWPIAAPLRLQSWGLTDFRVLDPDGYHVRLTSLTAS